LRAVVAARRIGPTETALFLAGFGSNALTAAATEKPAAPSPRFINSRTAAAGLGIRF